MKLLKYQQDWVNDKSRLKIMVKSRRIGGTFGTSYAVFRELMITKNHDVIVVTRDMRTAGDFIRDVTKWARAWNDTQPTNTRIPEKHMLKSQFSIPHQGGESRLITVSSNPDAAAGKGGSLIIDEFALHKDQELLVTVAKPIITAGGRLSIISTHRSKNSLFNTFVKEAGLVGSSWSLHSTTMEQAIQQGFVENVVNPMLTKLGEEPMTREHYLNDLRYNIINDEAIWEQEYMCIPSEAQYTLIPQDLCNLAVKPFEYDPGRACYLGWDIATSARGDYTCISIVQFNDDNSVKLIHYDAQKGIKLEAQRELIKQYVREYKVTKLCLDATGIGIDSSQILTEFYGETMCEGVSFGMQTKAEMAGRMLSIFQSEDICLPNDKALLKDINSIEKIYSAAGNITYHAPKLDGSHGDRFWSVALALKAAGWIKTNLYITPLSKDNDSSRPAIYEYERYLDEIANDDIDSSNSRLF